MSLQDTSQSSCELAHQSAGAKFTEHQVGVSSKLLFFSPLLSKDFKRTFTLTVFHMCCEQCARTHAHTTRLSAHRGCRASSGGLKLAYKACIKLKMDFPCYSAAVHRAEAFLSVPQLCRLERYLMAAELPPQSAELSVLYKQLQCSSGGLQQNSEQYNF